MVFLASQDSNYDNEIQYTPFGKISINFIEKNTGPPECRTMGPQNASGPFKPYKLTQNKTDLNLTDDG